MDQIHIQNIVMTPPSQRTAQDRAAILQQRRIEEHNMGEHPYGFMRRDCPLCQYAK